MEITPLMQNSESNRTTFINDAFKMEYEDYSSGYDSTDISDVESFTSEESRDVCDNVSCDSKVNLLPADNSDEVMNFQSAHALCDNLRLILAMPDLCDVTFLVGPNEVPVHGVRAVLGTRSRIFYQLILKHMSMKAAEEEKLRKSKKGKSSKKDKHLSGIGHSLTQKLVIPITKYDSEVFRLLIEFVHCGTVNITEDTVAGLFCAAHHFKLDDLSKACLDFVVHCIQIGNAKKILFSTRCYRQHTASKYLFEKIYSLLDGRYIKMLEDTAV